MITEDQLEKLCLEWFQTIGYDIAPDVSNLERSYLRHIILHDNTLQDIRETMLPKLHSGGLIIKPNQIDLEKTA